MTMSDNDTNQVPSSSSHTTTPSYSNKKSSSQIEHDQYVAVSVIRKQSQRHVGVAVYKRLQRSGIDDTKSSAIMLYEFLDNEQYSSLDSFLLHIGGCILYLSEEFEDITKGDGRKISNLLYGRDIQSVYVKKSLFVKKTDLNKNIMKLVGTSTHITNSAESERPIAYGCIECLLTSVNHICDDEYDGSCDIRFGSLDTVMRLDSAAAEAVNLLPKPDHPSQYGSIYGVLNRCKTKMGSRLLERWLRQPLVNVDDINNRLDIVEVLKDNTVLRNQLLDGPLKGIPDLDVISTKMQKKTAALAEVFRLYVFTRCLPVLINLLNELIDSYSGSSSSTKVKAFKTKFTDPLEVLNSKFSMYQQLVEHVIDMNSLPELIVNPMHDEDLKDLHEEQMQLDNQANKILKDAKDTWASFCDIKLERNPQHGYFLRTTRGDDEKQLRVNKSDVRIISILKNGVHLTVPALEKLGDRIKDIDHEYKHLQKGLVDKTVDTALSYLPLVEAASAIIAEIDLLCSFATAAALSPGDYVRPVIHPLGAGIIRLDNARHPCVELMDGVQFIPNNYHLCNDKDNFQIITGPNMGGKSTYIRGIGSIIVMAQMGSFVPCSKAEVTVVDSILARVGAGDAVQKGVSTFMAEMLEASVILETATANSLIIIDELGRGTSTFDGYGLAFAISEYIISHIKCPCLFATHFHELTSLSSRHANVSNCHVTALTDNNQVTMLYNVADGPCTQSFGIQVAATANFPKSVIKEAKRKANELEGINHDSSNSSNELYKRIHQSMDEFDKNSDIATATVDNVDNLKQQLNVLYPPYL